MINIWEQYSDLFKNADPLQIIFLILILLFLFIYIIMCVFLWKVFRYFKEFNATNLKTRMKYVEEIVEHNKKLGVPMGVKIGWKRFIIWPERPLDKQKKEKDET